MCNLLLKCIVLCLTPVLFDVRLHALGQAGGEIARRGTVSLSFGRPGLPVPARSDAQERARLRGDFPEYRPGARAAGRETFWR